MNFHNLYILRRIFGILLFICIFLHGEKETKGVFAMIYHKFQKYRKEFFLAAFLYLIIFSGQLLYDSIPDEIYAVSGQEEGICFSSVPVTVEKVQETIPVFHNINQTKDFTLTCKFLNWIPVKEVSVHVVEPDYVIPSGIPIGIYTKTKGVLIIGTGKVTAADGLTYDPADQIVRSGDYITAVNGTAISEKEELVNFVNQCGGQPLILGILRDEAVIEVKIDPIILEDGSYKIGIWVRDDMAGVGTMTYVKKDLEYGALGHPVSDADTGSMIELSGGTVYQTQIVGIVKGENGSPGELTGIIDYKEKYCLGDIKENTKTGIYGTVNQIPEGMKESYAEVCMKQDIQKGSAYILSSLDGTMRQYQIEIDDIDFNNKEENKGILFHVTDEKLLNETGGIVQGMSGSPILQDGKIIGAVTHVFVSDATKGYGVFIEKMMEH